MKKRKLKTSFTLRLIPAALIGLWAGTAGASGFQLQEQTASGIGNAFAGSAAVAENASTIFYNPAGMTQLSGTNVSFGVAAISPSYKFSNGASYSAFSGDGGDAGSLGYVPNGYFSMPVAQNLYFGLGVSAPFGLKTQYDNPWIGAAQSVRFEVKTINVNPSIAYKASDTVSVGFGLDWQKLDAKYLRRGSSVPAAYGLPYIAGNYTDALLHVKDDAWGWNAGVLFKVSPSTKVGISYRSNVKYNATGDISISSDGSAVGNLVAPTVAALRAGNVKADIKMPDTFVASFTHKLDDRWEMLGDLSWTGWSSIPKIDIWYTSGLANGTKAQTLHTDFRDTWRVALGANYKLRDDLKLKFGTAFDQAPVKGADSRLVSLPDHNRVWLSLGAQWMPSKTSTLDVGGAYLFINDASIHNDQMSNPAEYPVPNGIVDGKYKGSVWLVGVQYSVKF